MSGGAPGKGRAPGGPGAGPATLGWVRVTAVTAGLLVLAYGAWSALTWVPVRWWAPWALWLAGGVALHDGVLAPLVLALGWVVLGRVRGPRLRAVLRGAVLVLGTLLLVALVAVWAAAR